MTTLSGGGHYQFRVARHVGAGVAAHFPDLSLALNDDGTATLCGFVPDQAALHGVLGRIRDLGLTLIAVLRVESPAAEQPRGELNHD